MAEATGVLSGVRVIELAGLGPVPFCAMHLADMGAEVIRIERPGKSTAHDLFDAEKDTLSRNRRVMVIDLKRPQGVKLLRRLLTRADILLEGFRPKVLEKMGLAPEICWQENPKLVIGRMTGWGQSGPLAQLAAHDINYLSLSGALHSIGRAEGGPVPPINLIADFGAGAMHLATGVLAAYIAVKNGVNQGLGQVVDVAMTDTSIQLMAACWTLKNMGQWHDARQHNWLDGGAPFYDTYRCADDRWLAVGAIEAPFYALFLQQCGLAGDPDFAEQWNSALWARQKERLTALFAERPRAEWLQRFADSDSCVSPVLTMDESLANVHNQARACFVHFGDITQPAPAPRFSATPSSVRVLGSRDCRRDSRSILQDYCFSAAEIAALEAEHII